MPLARHNIDRRFSRRFRAYPRLPAFLPAVMPDPVSRTLRITRNAGSNGPGMLVTSSMGFRPDGPGSAALMTCHSWPPAEIDPEVEKVALETSWPGHRPV